MPGELFKEASVRRRLTGASLGQTSPARRRTAWVLAVVGPALVTLALLPFGSFFAVASVLLLVLLVVIAVAVIGGARPALASVAVGFLAGAYLHHRSYGDLRGELQVDLVKLIAFVVVGATVALLIDALARLAEEQSASRARIVAAADETRRRIERDLHDGAQQRLVSLALELRALQAAVPPELDDVEQALSRVAEGLAGVQNELMEMARGLHPAVLSRGGLEPALKTLVRRSPIPVGLSLHAEGRLPERIEVATYYLVAELLTNAAKHANASILRVEVETVGRALRVRVEDDGAGGADPTRGSGLVGLKDRVDALGGTIVIQSPPGAGTSVQVELPLED